MALAAWSLGLVTRLVEAWGLKLLAIDPDPWTKLLPTIGHDLELQGNRRQLRRRRVTNFYCKFFSQVAPYILWQNIV